MAFERRGNGSYYYRKVRKGKQVVSEYMGSGPAAILMAKLDGARLERGMGDREDWKAERERMDAEDAAVAELYDRVESLTRELLESAGYYRHKRGEWRKRHGTL